MSELIQKSIETLTGAVQSDPEYAWAWHCNIAMCSVDEGMERAAANRAAARFMKIFFNVDTTESPFWDFPKEVTDAEADAFLSQPVEDDPASLERMRKRFDEKLAAQNSSTA